MVKVFFTEVSKTLDLLHTLLDQHLDVHLNADPVVYEVETSATGLEFQINSIKLYVPVVSLPINDNIKFLENAKQGFERTISLKLFG